MTKENGMKQNEKDRGKERRIGTEAKAAILNKGIVILGRNCRKRAIRLEDRLGGERYRRRHGTETEGRKLCCIDRTASRSTCSFSIIIIVIIVVVIIVFSS